MPDGISCFERDSWAVFAVSKEIAKGSCHSRSKRFDGVVDATSGGEAGRKQHTETGDSGRWGRRKLKLLFQEATLTR